MGVSSASQHSYNIVSRRFFAKYHIISVDFFKIFVTGRHTFAPSKNLFVESHYKIVGSCIYTFGINVV